MTTGGLLDLRPALRPGILVGPALTRGPAVVHLLKDPVTGVRMEVGAKEHFIITRLDGSRSLADIGTEYAACFGARLGDAQWQQMLRLLSTRQLLDGGRPVTAVPGGADRDAPASGWFSGTTRMVADAPALMDRLHEATAFARRPGVLVPLLAAAAAVPVAVAVEFGELADQTGRLYHQPVTLAAVGCVLWISLGLHELAHGLVARAYGLRVGEIGLRRVWGLLTYLYCEVEDVQFLDRRGRQVAVAAAGAVMNLLFLLPFWPVWALLPDSAQALPALGGLLLLGTAMALLNLLPLPPLDGYKILGYVLGTLRLATESRTFLTVAAGSLRGADGGARTRLRRYPARLRLIHGGFALGCAVAALAVLAGAGLLCRATLPERYGSWTPYLPLAAIAAALALRVLGLRAAATRARAAARKAARQPPAAERPTSQPTVPARQSGTPPQQREKGDMTTQPRPAGTAIVLDGVSKRYGEVHALDDVTLTVGQGEFFGVLGPNGAGKTTLVEIVEGMRKADSGTVTVFGVSPWPRNTALLRRIGVQTQTSAFFTRLTAWEHLETVAALQGADRAAARDALELVGLADKERSRVDDLSGGQRQRLALATALVHRPDLIFLDEPTAALDPEARRSLWSVLRDLRGEGRTIVYTTHYLDEAEALCDRVAIIAGGKVVALDSPGALVRSMAAPARLLVPADRITVEQARAVEGAERVVLEGGEVVIETRHANKVLIELGALVDMDAIQTRTATLEDAYLRLTAATPPGAAETAGAVGVPALGKERGR
ncbi:ABC-type multidrug transport system, ATPase component [Actinacidiphila paucisporea]|uniref:ABC-type xenobiotic transporter n=2 Tax=Actinacidiphila paucisporea TaxID=310782 RepID=A0A1M7K7K2_9ACTN|nr:ABC-type multidrug transport system, ATPase component [Actinacidiphila paucisporea]